MARAVLLLEWIVPHRVDDQKAACFPFVSGHLRDLGIPVDWACVARGLDPFADVRQDLDDRAREALEDRVRALGATHALLSEPPTEALRDWLRGLGLSVVANETLPWHVAAQERRWLAGWLDLPGDPGGFLPDLATPDYRCTDLDGRLAGLRVPVRLVGESACAYAAPLQGNPAFDGLDLSGLREHGCAFCVRPPTAPPTWRTPPVELALRQVRAAAGARPTLRDPSDLEVDSVRLARRVDDLLEAAAEAGLPPSRFRIWLRADEVVRFGDRIGRALARAAAAGHRLCLGPMGIENFSEAENRRFNKGFGVDEVRRAEALVQAWQREFPGALVRESRFGSILFTPWTTLADLEANLRGAREFDLPPAFFLTRRLMLLRDGGLRRLAERDGLLEPEDPADRALFERLRACDPGCRHLPEERDAPWRFRDRRVAAVCDVTLRMAGEGLPLPRDAADDRLAAALEGAGLRDRLLDAFEGLLEAAREAGDAPSAGDLLESFLARLPAPAAPPPEPDPPPDPLEALRDRFRRLADRDPALMRGFALQGLSRAGGVLVLEFRRPDGVFILRAAPGDRAPADWPRRLGVALSYDRSTPSVDGDRAALMALVAGVLSPREARRGPGGPEGGKG